MQRILGNVWFARSTTTVLSGSRVAQMPAATAPVSQVDDLKQPNDQNHLVPQLSTNYISRRFGRNYRKWYHWPNDFLPFQWEREKPDPPHFRSGDAVRDVGLWDPKSLILGAEYSKELQNAPDIVRRQFSLEFSKRRQIVDFQKKKILEQVQRHPFDQLSPETRIADFTIRIRNNLHHFSKIDPYDARRKITQNRLICRRNVILKELFYKDRARFDYITRVLGIEYTPPKLGEMYRKPTRKAELRRLTKEYCEKLKDEKLVEYHQELKVKQATLDDEKKKIEELFEKEEKYLGTQNN